MGRGGVGGLRRRGLRRGAGALHKRVGRASILGLVAEAVAVGVRLDAGLDLRFAAAASQSVSAGRALLTVGEWGVPARRLAAGGTAVVNRRPVLVGSDLVAGGDRNAGAEGH